VLKGTHTIELIYNDQLAGSWQFHQLLYDSSGKTRENFLETLGRFIIRRMKAEAETAVELDEQRRILGIIHLHDLLKAGVI